MIQPPRLGMLDVTVVMTAYLSRTTRFILFPLPSSSPTWTLAACTTEFAKSFTIFLCLSLLSRRHVDAISWHDPRPRRHICAELPIRPGRVTSNGDTLGLVWRRDMRLGEDPPRGLFFTGTHTSASLLVEQKLWHLLRLPWRLWKGCA